jgi:hypothetical protein
VWWSGGVLVLESKRRYIIRISNGIREALSFGFSMRRLD